MSKKHLKKQEKFLIEIHPEFKRCCKCKVPYHEKNQKSIIPLLYKNINRITASVYNSPDMDRLSKSDYCLICITDIAMKSPKYGVDFSWSYDKIMDWIRGGHRSPHDIKRKFRYVFPSIFRLS